MFRDLIMALRIPAIFMLTLLLTVGFMKLIGF